MAILCLEGTIPVKSEQLIIWLYGVAIRLDTYFHAELLALHGSYRQSLSALERPRSTQ